MITANDFTVTNATADDINRLNQALIACSLILI